MGSSSSQLNQQDMHCGYTTSSPTWSNRKPRLTSYAGTTQTLFSCKTIKSTGITTRCTQLPCLRANPERIQQRTVSAPQGGPTQTSRAQETTHTPSYALKKAFLLATRQPRHLRHLPQLYLTYQKHRACIPHKAKTMFSRWGI